MQAKDVMTKDVVVVRPQTRVEEVARMLLERRISAVPVVDAGGELLGIVSEGDLLRRPEIETDHTSWWLRLFATGPELAHDYVKTHGTEAHHVMTTEVATVAPDCPLGEIARLLEKRRIKRVPVLEDGVLVGIVSRANLLHGLAARPADGPREPSADDRTVREAVLERLREAPWSSLTSANVVVSDGVVDLWGWVNSKEEREALRLLIETTPGVARVQDHLVDDATLGGAGYV